MPSSFNSRATPARYNWKYRYIYVSCSCEYITLGSVTSGSVLRKPLSLWHGLSSGCEEDGLQIQKVDGNIMYRHSPTGNSKWLAGWLRSRGGGLNLLIKKENVTKCCTVLRTEQILWNYLRNMKST